MNTRWVVKSRKEVRKTRTLLNQTTWQTRASSTKNSNTRIRSFYRWNQQHFFWWVNVKQKLVTAAFGSGHIAGVKKEGQYSESSILFDGKGSDKNVPYAINSSKSLAHKMNTVSSTHVGGAHLLFGDGRVRFLSENLDVKTYRALTTHAGKEEIGEY